jgi:hypothetical protein
MVEVLTLLAWKAGMSVEDSSVTSSSPEPAA